MRRRDKLKNIEKANLLAEQRHLESKGVLTKGILKEWSPSGADEELKQFHGYAEKEIEQLGLTVKTFDLGSSLDKGNKGNIGDDHVTVSLSSSGGHGTHGVMQVVIPAKLGEDKAKKVSGVIKNIANRMKNGSNINVDFKFDKTRVGDNIPAYVLSVRLTSEEQQAGNPEKLGLREDIAYKTASNNELAQYIVNLSNELTAAKSHGDEKEIGYIMKDLAEVKAELESRKKAKTNEKLELGENISGIGDISVEIKHDNGETVVKGRVEPTDIGFVIYNENQDGRPFNIVWKEKLNKFVSGESMWYDEQDVVATSGYEDAFSKLEASYGKTDLKEGQMYDGIEWESVGSGRDDMGYEHVIGTDNEGKFYEASAIINMRDEIESINDIEEMSEDDYNKLA